MQVDAERVKTICLFIKTDMFCKLEYFKIQIMFLSDSKTKATKIKKERNSNGKRLMLDRTFPLNSEFCFEPHS